MKIFETIAEVVGWIKIVIAPLALGALIGWLIYYNKPDTIGIILGIVFSAIGLGLGIYWATKAWKGKGTVFVATRHMHSPDLDKKETQEQESKK